MRLYAWVYIVTEVSRIGDSMNIYMRISEYGDAVLLYTSPPHISCNYIIIIHTSFTTIIMHGLQVRETSVKVLLHIP